MKFVVNMTSPQSGNQVSIIRTENDNNYDGFEDVDKENIDFASKTEKVV